MTAQQTGCLVSIIINNYNYGRYLSKAIESALAQSYPHIEVIVVDDGSSDDSRAVMAAYGDRIIPLLKENGGQASALNAGVAQSHGDVIFFLDADDTLHPTVVERAVAHFTQSPEVARVQFRLAIIDAYDKETGDFKPPAQQPIPGGDMQQNVLLYGDDIAWLPTSGNAFRSSVLRQIFPIPEAEYRLCADYYLSNLSPLFGRVAALDQPGGYYRVHGANHHERAQLDLEHIRHLIVRTQQTHTYMAHYARQLGVNEATLQAIATHSLTFLANRLVLLRLDPARYPIHGDNSGQLLRQGILAAWQRSDLSLLMRLLYTAWFLAASFAPPAGVRWLAEQLFFPDARGRWFHNRLISLHRVRPQANMHA